MTVRATLAGKRIVLVEGDSFLAGYVGDGLAAAGAEVVGPFASAEEARPLLAGAHAAVRTLQADDDALPLPTLWTSARAATGRGEPSCLYRPFGAFQIVEAVERLLVNA